MEFLADNTLNIQTSSHVEKLESQLQEALAQIEELKKVRSPSPAASPPKISKPKAIKKFNQ